MTKEQVLECINGYRGNKARAEFLKVREDELAEIIAEVKAHAAYYATSTTAAYSGMPGGGVVESKVERIAITLAEGKLPGDLRELEIEADEVKAERQRCIYRCRAVEAWLKVLNPREHFVIAEHCLNGRIWRETAALFYQQFGEEYSTDGLKRLTKESIQKIMRIAH